MIQSCFVNRRNTDKPSTACQWHPGRSPDSEYLIRGFGIRRFGVPHLRRRGAALLRRLVWDVQAICSARAWGKVVSSQTVSWSSLTRALFMSAGMRERLAAGELDVGRRTIAGGDFAFALEDDPDGRLIVGDFLLVAFAHADFFRCGSARRKPGGETAVKMPAMWERRLDAGDIRRAEIDAGHGLFDLQFSAASPVEDAVGGVAGGLDFGDHDARAEGVAGAAGDVMAVADFDGDADEHVLDALGVVGGEGGAELGGGDAGLDAFEEGGSGVGVDDVPGFGFEEGVGVGADIGGAGGGFAERDFRGRRGI